MENKIENIREYLQRERGRLTENLAAIVGQDIDERREDSSLRKNENAQAYAELEKRSVNTRNVKGSLSEVEHALDKLEKGTYGLCDCCGKPIPLARLEALPQATYCIDCKVKMPRSLAIASSY